ncbi:Ribosomal silencing factor RsfS [Usitatibacter rugosus]|uniref:Ribosomal silencing factor RsfS n=2 Tax=Usitatibacter rugosus TaxID=2732067 RepID=A0A6M4GQP2_9PROT|nr:ribosome silencing factor [Usitatibacter rugosus]QJR09108.1 Ribosomal silencing factor RsfS [Usitatibacter rugosus]
MTSLSTPAKKRLVVEALDDIKARDILAIDVRKVTYAFDWIVVATAESARQTKALAHHVKDKLKEAGSVVIGMEGEGTGDWILVDAGDVVAHIMQPVARRYYNLEELWGEGKSDPVVNSTEPVDTTTIPVPTRPPRKKTEAKEPAAKKPTVKKPVAKKPAAKKPAVKKPAEKKPAVKKPAAKKPVAKKTVAKKPAAKKAVAKKPAAKKAAVKKKPAAKKAAKKRAG